MSRGSICISSKFIFQQCTIKDHKILHNHLYTWMKPDDTLLAVAREPKLIELATVDMNSSGQDSANWEGSGSRTGTFQKFQNSLRNTYFSPLYILIYTTFWAAFDSISWSDIVPWCYWFYSIVMHHKSEQLYRQDKIREGVVDVNVACHMFLFILTIMFERFKTEPCWYLTKFKYYFYICLILLKYSCPVQLICWCFRV